MARSRTSIVLTDKQLAALRQLAKETGLRFSELVRRAIDEYLAKHEKKS